MPAAVSAGDRKILFVAGGAFLLLVIVGFLFAPAGDAGADAATTYSTASRGAKAAYCCCRRVDTMLNAGSILPPNCSRTAAQCSSSLTLA